MTQQRHITRIAINGARGRLGSRIASLARSDQHFELVASINRNDEPVIAPGTLDVVLDVSSDEGARRAISIARNGQSAVLIATTGLSEQSLADARSASNDIPVLVAPNTSLGVAVMKHIAVVAARLLGPSFDASLIEYHHVAKKDAPSGTARSIALAIDEATGRKNFQKNLAGIRVGDVIGEHVLRFSGPSESLEITHRAGDRDLFARGALRAAQWLARQQPGAYTIEQAIGIESERTTR